MAIVTATLIIIIITISTTSVERHDNERRRLATDERTDAKDDYGCDDCDDCDDDDCVPVPLLPGAKTGSRPRPKRPCVIIHKNAAADAYYHRRRCSTPLRPLPARDRWPSRVLQVFYGRRQRVGVFSFTIYLLLSWPCVRARLRTVLYVM